LYDDASLAGIVVGVYFGSLTGANRRPSGAGAVTLELQVFLPLQQMLYAGMAEEPFFRGFPGEPSARRA
jgi:hypothetical protein